MAHLGNFSACVIGGTTAALLVICPARAFDNHSAGMPGVVVTPLVATTITASGQPITLPKGNAEVIVSTFDIAPGATLPVHKHPFPRYAYVLAGDLRVTNTDTKKSDDYKAGDFIVEMIGEWHQGTNIGTTPVKLLVIDQVDKGAVNTVLRD
ncbi:cupin domain-containing protein [Chelatococcus sp. YT9]|uniref:cupin domain-containing protein n=1 Tax=Chelatococcus sp. YT9 TaxID=2835635 RepID=UPI001BCFE0CA|nr:cupin domain-containing protein [Chelatococcus sp. YT9]MBS7698838.1 cupin domain-containing protein [Chelatococcus sp. YT9]